MLLVYSATAISPFCSGLTDQHGTCRGAPRTCYTSGLDYAHLIIIEQMENRMAEVTTPEGLKYEDIQEGTGQEAKAGDRATVHYTGWLTNGQKFDSSKDRNEPFQFPLGGRRVIPGWDIGVQGMKIGGVRKLTIPPELGYGARNVGPIPANSTLVFEVELLGLD